MDSLMPELVAMIYDLLTLPHDSIKFSLTCKYIFNCMHNELKRILKICAKYQDIRTAITSINYSIQCCSSSVKYNDREIIYHGNCLPNLSWATHQSYYRHIIYLNVYSLDKLLIYILPNKIDRYVSDHVLRSYVWKRLSFTHPINLLTSITILMPELIAIIYSHLSLRDQAKFSFTCKYVHDAMSFDQRRVLNIYRRYIPIWKEINNIRYVSFCNCASERIYQGNMVTYDTEACPYERSKIILIPGRYQESLYIIDFNKLFFTYIRNDHGSSIVEVFRINNNAYQRVNFSMRRLAYRHMW